MVWGWGFLVMIAVGGPPSQRPEQSCYGSSGYNEALLYVCLMPAITEAGAVVVSGDELTHLGESS